MPKNHSSSPNVYKESLILRKDGLFKKASKDRLATLLFGVAHAYLKEIKAVPESDYESVVMLYLNHVYDKVFNPALNRDD